MNRAKAYSYLGAMLGTGTFFGIGFMLESTVLPLEVEHYTAPTPVAILSFFLYFFVIWPALEL
jgi:hypothetical protein